MKSLPVAIQVYGLRDLLENTPENFKNVMEEVKYLGYDGVELAGDYGLKPEFIRDTLNEIGLVPLSAHVPFADMMENLDKVIDEYKTIGVQYLVMPYMAEEYRPGVNREGFDKFIPLLNKVGEKIHAAGMTFLYHNHDFEFVRLENGKWGYDEMFESIPHENLMPELDTCWCDVATGEPVKFIKKYTGRIPVVHLKDYIKKGQPKNMYKLIGIDSSESEEDDGSYFGYRPLGFGQMIWQPVLEQAIASGTQWVVVEQDEHYDLNPLEAARRSRDYLRIFGW